MKRQQRPGREDHPPFDKSGPGCKPAPRWGGDIRRVAALGILPDTDAGKAGRGDPAGSRGHG